jgi:ubiquinone/menaquinone biosynthesis C-methylase UbiE
MQDLNTKSKLPDPGMSNTRISFYKNTIYKWITDKNASILVIGGGETDRSVFHSMNFNNVIISNLDSRLKGDEFAPYQWSFQKAEGLSYNDEEFDFVVVHAALHHCESPHRALLEMYRVAKVGIIAFESRDSFLMKFLEKVQLTLTYEHVTVYNNGCEFGGVNNTEIPNYIYRWTEREIEKTINTYSPYAKHDFQYQYGNDIPYSMSLEKNASLKGLVVSLAKPFYQFFTILFPKQQNLFAFHVQKPNIPRDLHEWLTMENKEIKFNSDWARRIYK